MANLKDHERAWNIDTQAIRAGIERTNEGENSTPIFANSSFVFADSEEAAARFSGDIPGNIYSRFTNPTINTFERRIAMLEACEWGIATGSGMAAITTAIMGYCEAGDHIVASRSLFGTVNVLVDEFLPRFGIEVTTVELSDYDAWQAAIQPNTKLLFLETPSNPLMELADMRLLADMAHKHDALFVVDNCFATPIVQRPAEFGADMVVHSATKFLDGQGRAVGGVVVGRDDNIYQRLYKYHKTLGAAISPFNAWVFLKGLETLPIRVRAENAAAFELATWLEQQPKVSKVYYPGLESHPQHELATRQQQYYGAVVTFEVEGGREAAWQVIDNTTFMSITANLGDVRSTITHPATTTHGKLSAAERERVGIGDGLVRIAVGLEDINDIKTDLLRGLAC